MTLLRRCLLLHRYPLAGPRLSKVCLLLLPTCYMIRPQTTPAADGGRACPYATGDNKTEACTGETTCGECQECGPTGCVDKTAGTTCTGVSVNMQQCLLNAQCSLNPRENTTANPYGCMVQLIRQDARMSACCCKHMRAVQGLRSILIHVTLQIPMLVVCCRASVRQGCVSPVWIAWEALGSLAPAPTAVKARRPSSTPS